MKQIIIQPMTAYEDGQKSTTDQALITEEPLSIRVNGNAYSVVMRTPGDEKAHAAGFCLAEGLIDSPADLVTIGSCTEDGTNVATVTLTEARRAKVADLLERKGFVSQTSCGICGKEVIEDIQQITAPIAANHRFGVERIMACIDTLPDYQPIYRQTRSSHAAMILDEQLSVLGHAEDVGRHNAIDKAVGKVLMAETMDRAVLAVMSSRLSYELVQKGARAGLEMLVGISRPTALAVEVARSVNMTLACAKDDVLMIFCGEQRFTS
ncbi:MAG: formate dehydrogenase accessory sulfurtransferase FdhD [Thermodesulfobacteriota bacterium]